MNGTRTARAILVGAFLISMSACSDNGDLDAAREDVTALEAEKISLQASLAEREALISEQEGALEEQEAATAEQGQSLILQADIVGEGCMLQNAYLNNGEAKATFRVRVYDPLTGEQLGDDAVESVIVTLGDGQELELNYGGHPPDTEIDFFWAVGWEIFADYPPGNISYDIVATANDGRTGTFEPFNVAPSLLTVLDAAAVSEEPADGDEAAMRTVDAPIAAITVDGDPSDWADVEGVEFTMEAIADEDVESHNGTFKAAHDDEYLYVLFTVDDDFDWNADDAHLSAASAVLWAVDEGAGSAMGAEEPDRNTSLGMVDIWHWELECAIGEEMGGRVAGPGDGVGGNDSGCNLDDEWSTNPETREDDNGEGAENSLLGVFGHSNPVADGAGTWYFEISRPLQTGDVHDAQFAVGDTSLLALAYWDPDVSVEGWDDAGHVQTANQGFIAVTLT